MLRKICDLLTTILIIVLLIVAIILVGPTLVGGKTLAVLSGSMEPEIPVGSIVIVMDEEASNLQFGDIATYRMNGDTMVTHRVLENNIEEKYLIFKGDANDVPDANPILYSDVEGKVLFHLPLLGYLSIYIRTPLGVTAGCGVIFLFIVLAFLPDVFEKEKKEHKN